MAHIHEVVYSQQLHLQWRGGVVEARARGRVMIPNGPRSDLERHGDQKARIGRAET